MNNGNDFITTGVCSFKYLDPSFWDDLQMFQSQVQVLVPDPKEVVEDEPFEIIREQYIDRDLSFIINHDSGTVQVLQSKWAKLCYRCSLCYPGQGNLEELVAEKLYETDNGVWAYDLPEEWKRSND